jgi:uncharacterized protein (DUF433 family)
LGGQTVTPARPVRLPRTLPFGLDGGIYLQSEVALLTGLKQSTVRRWLELEREASGLQSVTEQPLVSFHDLISLRAVAALRHAGMKLRKIKQGADFIRHERGLTHPLAWEKLTTDGVHLYFPEAPAIVEAQDDAEIQTLIAASEAGQLAAQDLVAAYLRDVKYKPLGGGYRLAASWEPPGVSIDPSIQRGAPCVEGSRMQIAQLKRYLDAGDTPEYLAELFELDADDIRRAVNWYVKPKLAA